MFNNPSFVMRCFFHCRNVCMQVADASDIMQFCTVLLTVMLAVAPVNRFQDNCKKSDLDGHIEF